MPKGTATFSEDTNNMSKKKLINILILLTVSVLFSACFMVPVIDSFRRSELTPAGRRTELARVTREFHKALYWGRTEDSLAHVSADKRQQMADMLSEWKEQGRVVETALSNTDFDDEFRAASLDVVIKYHQFSTNLISPLKRRESWIYEFENGWKLNGIEVIESGGAKKHASKSLS